MKKALLLGAAVGLVGAGLLAGCAETPPPRERVVVEERFVARRPPPPMSEVIIEAPGPRERFVWDPGHYVWDGYDYHWSPGRWIARRDGHWVPSEWVETPRGWRFVPGHWQS